jgi:hypothetical protein
MFAKFILLALFIFIVGGFGYFAFTDVPVAQTKKIETIQAEDFLNN